MRKCLSLITALVLCTTFVSAKTIYCKMEHSWWKVDNAAVGCHSWGTPGPGTNWPGVRMTPVEGETDLWSIELDTDKVQNVIFTRVNASGAIADWGAKTKDLQIPTNGDNLFTITTSSESWGDPGCDGTWSKYEAPAGGLPQITEAPKSWAGEYVITAMKDENTALVWTGIDAGQCRVEAPVVNNKLTDDNFVKVVVEALQDGGYSLKVKGGTNDGKYMTQAATPTYGNGLKFVENPVRVDIEMNDKGLVDIYQTINATQKVYFLYNATAGSTNERFRFYKGTNHGLSNYYSLTLFGTVAPETKYYAKNNWNGAASEDWSWLEMKKEEDLYVLDSVVFGGTGVNINTKEEDADAKWFDLKKMKYNEQDTIQALDTVRFELAVSDKDTVLTAILLGRPAPVARKEFVFVAGETAEANPTMFAITWGKDGSNETVKMTQKGEEALYTANILETVDSVVLVRCASDATEIIWDGEGKNVWNQTANYELCDTMYFESWVEETNLFAIKCDTPEPVETKYYAKNNWNGAASEDWSWLEMKKEEDLYVLDSVVFGGTGVNINDKEDDTDALWFAADAITVLDDLVGLVPPDPTHHPGFPKDSMPRWAGIVGAPTLLAGDTIKLFFNAADSTLKAFIVGRPAPVARKEFVFVAGEAAEANPAMFAITWGKDGSSETVKMEKEEALYAADILATVDSVVLVRCATGATEIIWGEGTNVWNQTANYELCDTMYFESWVEETNLFAIKCDTPEPVETKYYAKNNWNGAASEDWSWLEMSATNKENVYMLDSVVFGGTGVNINDKEDDTDALWFAADAITVLDGLDGLPGPNPPKPQGRDTIPYAPARMVAPLEAPTLLAGDTIKLFFNAADSTLSAAIVGRPEQPQPVEVKYYITGNAALCGEKAWDAQAIEMKDSTHTFEAMAAGEYEMKITNGAWDPEGQSWGSAALSDACSAGVDNKDGNIHFIVETPNNVVVSIANGKVTVTGTFKESSVTAGIKVNVTVPDGTPACFFYGEMSGNTFAEMTKVDETHYTIDFPKATTIGWGYLFVWENGNWNTKNADPEGDIKVEPVEGVINVEIKAWVTAPGTEYKYTTYTEWQVKFGPAWEWVNMTKQEDGTFTVEAVWGNTGINIASGDNPIKQDWYPLDDAALTVAEDVAEGDNVVISLTVVNDNTVALNVAKVTPITPEYGLLVNNTDYLAGQPEDKGEYTEYAVSTTLAIGDFVQLYDNVAKAAWTVTPEGAGFTNFDIHDNAYYIKQAGAYQFYIKIPKEGMNSSLYVGFQEATGLNTLKGQSGQRYNILGQPVDASYRGLVIMNGQTFLQK